MHRCIVQRETVHPERKTWIVATDSTLTDQLLSPKALTLFMWPLFLFQLSTFQRFHRIPKQHYQLGPRVKEVQTDGDISQPHQTRDIFNIQILSLFSSQSELTQKSHLFHKITFKFLNKLPSPQQFPGMALILTSPGPITQFPFPLCSPERIFSSASLPVMECSFPSKVIRDPTSLPEYHIFARIYPWEDWKFYTLGSYWLVYVWGFFFLTLQRSKKRRCVQ